MTKCAEKTYNDGDMYGAQKAAKPTGIFNCSALPLRATSRRIGRLVTYYLHTIEKQPKANTPKLC